MGTKCLAALLLLGACASASVWTPNLSYNYIYDGWIATGIPEVDQQFAGIHLSGRFVVEPESETAVKFALKDTTARKFNQAVDKSVRKDPKLWKNLGEVVEIFDREVLERPAMITFKGDEFESLTVSSNEPLWAINMKKALAVKLQLQLSGAKGGKAAIERLTSGEKNIYPVMESCVTGECELWYEISELPEERIKSEPLLVPSPTYCSGGNFYEIVKTANYDKCIKNPVLANVSPFGWRCVPGTNTCGASKTRNIIPRVNPTNHVTEIRGYYAYHAPERAKTLVVQRQVTADTEIIKPFGSDTEPIEAMNFIKLDLASIEKTRTLQEPKGKTMHSLVYAHTMDQLSGGPIPQPGLKDPMVQRGHAPLKVVEQEIRRLISEVVRDLETNEFLMAPEKFGVSGKMDMLRLAASALPYKELKSILSREIAMNQDTTENQVAMSILTNAGTNPAILILKEQVLSGKLSGEKARQSFSFLPATIKTPTVGILTELVDLLESKLAEEDPIFENTIALAVSNILYNACVNKTMSRRLYPTAVMGDFCSPNEPLIVKKLIPYFAKQIETAETNFEKLTYLTALGNLGHEAVIPVIASVIEGEENLEHSLREWHTKHGLPSEYSVYKAAAKHAFEMEEEELEELEEMTQGKKGSWTKKYFEELVKGKKTKRSLRSRFEKETSGKGRSQYFEEEEEEYEMSPAMRRKHSIPSHEKINKGILKKYGVPMEDVREISGRRGGMKSYLEEEEEEEIELTPAQRRKHGIPSHEKINKGILKKYGVPLEDVMETSRRGKSGSRFEEEEEEEFELTASQRRKHGIPSHEKINKGILKKYGVPLEDVMETSSRRGGKSGSRYEEEEEEEEFELTAAQRRKHGIPSQEKINRGILKKYGVPLEDAMETSSRRGGKSGHSGYFDIEEEEEEFELTQSERRRFGIPESEKINKGILKKYGVPLEVAEPFRVSKHGQRRSEKSGSGKAHRGGKHRRSGKAHRHGGKTSSESEEYESDLIPRIKAVWALRKLALAENPKALHLLTSVFFNTNEDPEVRIAALNMIFISDAPVSVWERIAVGTWFEPSYQVRQYIATSLHSLSALETPNARSRMIKASAVLPLAKPMDWSVTGSSNYIGSFYDVNENAGHFTQFSTLFGNSSALPLKAFLSVNQKQGAFEFNAIKTGILGQQFWKLVQNWLPRFYTKGTEKVHPELKSLRDYLDIETRGEDEAPEAYFYFGSMNAMERMWPINQDTPKHLMQALTKSKSKGNDINYRKWTAISDIYASVPMEMGIPALVGSHWKILNNLVGNVNVTSKDVEVEIAASSGFKIITTIAFDVPFVNKVVSSGVDMNSFITLPGTACVKVDTKQGKVALEVEPMRGKISFFHYHVKPFTSTKDSFDLTPLDQVSDKKLVTVHEGPLEVQIPLKEQVLGLNLEPLGIKVYVDHKADSKKMDFLSTTNFWAHGFLTGNVFNRVVMAIPRQVRYRENKWVLDVPASETKAIKVALDIAAAAQPVSEDVTIIRSGTNRVKEVHPAPKDRVETIFGRLDKEKSENLMSVFESTIGGQAVTADASVELIGSSIRKYEASVTLGVGGLGLVQKASVHVARRAGAGTSNKICIDAEINWPKLTSLKREYYLGSDLTTGFSLNIGHGFNCETKRGFTVEGKMTQTAEQVAFAKSSPEAQLCKRLEMEENVMVASAECEEARNQATDLNRYELEFDYPASPSETLTNITTKIENLIKFVGFRHLHENRNVKNPNHKIKLVYELEPASKKVANVEIFAPHTNIFLTNIPMGMISRTVLPINVRLPLVANILNTVDICAIEGNRVHTFDNTPYEVELSRCDHVLAADCSGNLDIAVLGREENGKKIATILYKGDKVVVNPASKSVVINGNEQPLVEDKVVLSVDESGMTNIVVREVGDGFFEVRVPGIGRVTISSDKIVILTNGLQKGATCGMCGSGNSEKVSDLEGPRGCTLSSGRHLAVAYMLETPKGKCSSDRRHEEAVREFKKEQGACLKGEPYANLAEVMETVVQSPVFQSAIGSESSGSDCSIFRNRMITRGGLRCFSTIAIPQCKPGCKEVNMIEKRVGFHCVPKGRLAEHLLEQYQHKPLNELYGREEQTSEVLRVPTSCL